MSDTLTLPNIARAMQQKCLDQAEAYPDLAFWCAQHALPRGLGLTLEMREDTWTLSLSRAGMPPSQAEIDTICGGFNLPADAALTRGLCESKWRQTKIVRLRWVRNPYEQKGLFDESEAKAA